MRNDWTRCKLTDSERKARAEKEQQYAEMVDEIIIRADGSTFTKLKPGIADGAEFSESWKQWKNL